MPCPDPQLGSHSDPLLVSVLPSRQQVDVVKDVAVFIGWQRPALGFCLFPVPRGQELGET